MRCLRLVTARASTIVLLGIGRKFARTLSASHLTCTKTSPIMAEKSSPQSSFAYESGSSSVAFVTTPDTISATKIAHALISQKLAACVNLIPQITSIYEWDGKVNEDSETLLMIKTRTSRVDELAKYVRENHPYSVAEVIALPIESGNPPYLEWLAKSVPPNK